MEIWTSWVKIGLLSLLWLVLSYTPMASAFNAPTSHENGDSAAYAYRVDQSFVARFGSAESAARADSMWYAQNLWKYARIYHDEAAGAHRPVYYGDVQFPGNTAEAYTNDGGCDTADPPVILTIGQSRYEGSCIIAVNSTTNWNDYDLVSVLGQEFGHWLALGHSDDLPSTDPRNALMRSPFATFEQRRAVRQDDASGLHAARPRWRHLAANDSYEFDTPFWGWGLLRPNGGSATRYCNDWTGAWHGNCFVEFQGLRASYYQDVHNNSWLQNDLLGRVRVRNRGTQDATVRVAVWKMSLSPPEAVEATCNGIPPMTPSTTRNWYLCYTPLFDAANSTWLRIEVYNDTGANLDIDTLIVGRCNPQICEDGNNGGVCLDTPRLQLLTDPADTGGEMEDAKLAAGDYGGTGASSSSASPGGGGPAPLAALPRC